MALKKYKHRIYRKLSTSVRDEDGKKHTVVFSGGIGGQYKVGGHFITDNEKCQKALESDPRFNVEFDLCFEYRTTEEKNGTPIIEKITEGLDVCSSDEVDNQYEIIDTPMDKQSVRIFFRDKGEANIAPNLTKTAVLKLCDKYKVTFSNLQF